METKKIKALEAVIAALEISESELKDWFNNRGGFIPTDLPLVYRRGNELTVENGLDLSRTSELWGIQLLSGAHVALKCGGNVPVTTREEVKKMRLNGKPGFLPSKDVLKKHWGSTEKEKFVATIKILRKNEIEADNYLGCLWCSERFSPFRAYYFDLEKGEASWDRKYAPDNIKRIAVMF